MSFNQWLTSKSGTEQVKLKHWMLRTCGLDRDVANERLKCCSVSRPSLLQLIVYMYRFKSECVSVLEIRLI